MNWQSLEFNRSANAPIDGKVYWAELCRARFLEAFSETPVSSDAIDALRCGDVTVITVSESETSSGSDNSAVDCTSTASGVSSAACSPDCGCDDWGLVCVDGGLTGSGCRTWVGKSRVTGRSMG